MDQLIIDQSFNRQLINLLVYTTYSLSALKGTLPRGGGGANPFPPPTAGQNEGGGVI